MGFASRFASTSPAALSAGVRSDLVRFPNPLALPRASESENLTSYCHDVCTIMLFQVVNAWYNGPVAGRFGCFSFAMFGMLGGLAQVFPESVVFKF